jgi:hypothetical protein
VLRRLSKEISECYRLAEEARAWAEQASDSRTRKDLLLVEQGWLMLARSHEFSESLTQFTSSRGRTRKTQRAQQ